MAGTKLDRIGTIFTRVTSLLRTGAMKEENTPLWYDVYKAFPPTLEPRFNRKPHVSHDIRDILYEEDEIRARLHLDISLPPVDMKSHKVSHTQIFLAIYNSLKKSGIEKEEAYDQALKSYKIIFSQKKFASVKKQTNERDQQTDSN